MVYILIYNKQLIYKRLCWYINLYIEKQHVFLLRIEDFCSIYTFQIKSSFDLKSINQEFIVFLKLLKKHFIQYCTVEL